jgi:methionine aminopeptidase
VKGQDPNEKMEEGEHFAIETFGSTGNGWVRDQVSFSSFIHLSSLYFPSA